MLLVQVEFSRTVLNICLTHIQLYFTAECRSENSIVKLLLKIKQCKTSDTKNKIKNYRKGSNGWHDAQPVKVKKIMQNISILSYVEALSDGNLQPE